MAFLPVLMMAATVASGIAGAVGAVAQGQAQSKAANYNAQLSLKNAAVSRENAAIAGQAGSEQAAMSSQRTRAEVGAIKSGQAGGGIEVNSGSAVDTQTSAKELGDLDALTIRSNATKEAYGYETQAQNYENQSTLDRFEAKNDATSGWISGASTLLGTVGQAGSEWSQFKMAGSL